MAAEWFLRYPTSLISTVCCSCKSFYSRVVSIDRCREAFPSLFCFVNNSLTKFKMRANENGTGFPASPERLETIVLKLIETRTRAILGTIVICAKYYSY